VCVCGVLDEDEEEEKENEEEEEKEEEEEVSTLFLNAACARVMVAARAGVVLVCCVALRGRVEEGVSCLRAGVGCEGVR